MKRMQWRKSTLLPCAIALAGLLAGCGVKSAPQAPELVQPERIQDLSAAADHAGIRLSWQRPTHYAGGHLMRDLGSFVILRGTAAGSMTPLVELPVTDRERFSVERDFSYIDGATAMNGRYRYEVLSKTVDGYVSEPSNEVEFTRVKPAPAPNPDDFHLPPAPAPPDLSN
jgi:hypothetical protein